jgi:hypothetical protein
MVQFGDPGVNGSGNQDLSLTRKRRRGNPAVLLEKAPEAGISAPLDEISLPARPLAVYS